MTSNNTLVGYVDEPPGRGTWSLVISCLLTLILCVWSALHLNVPARGRSQLSTLLLNARWILTGIYAPELVVFTAWRQWSAAKYLTRIVEASKRSGEKGVPEWSMAHSFFACTGGFVFEIESFRELLSTKTGTEAEAAGPVRLTLTARGVGLLAEHGLLPHVSREEILDKSKANNLAKAAVIIQAGWMMLQVIGRLCAQLPVTLLEVNTVAHVLCAFAMYMFWWNKPLLPEEPVAIRDEELLPLATFMYTSSEMSGYVDKKSFQSQTAVKTLFAHLRLYSRTPEIETLAVRSSSSAERTRAEISYRQETKLVKPGVVQETQEVTGLVESIDGASVSCQEELKHRKEKEAGTAFFERRPRLINAGSDDERLCDQARGRRQQVLRALKQYPKLSDDKRIALNHEVGGTQCRHLRPEQFVAGHIQNWPGDDLLRNVDGLVVGMVLWLANFCYGGIHAAAWNEHFPSTVEQWLWRGSACYIGFCGGLWVVLNFIVSNYPPLNEFWERWMDGEKAWWQSFGLGVVVFVCGFSLILARIFIVVEAFVSIRELPAKAYETPEWTDIFPHF